LNKGEQKKERNDKKKSEKWGCFDWGVSEKWNKGMERECK